MQPAEAATHRSGRYSRQMRTTARSSLWAAATRSISLRAPCRKPRVTSRSASPSSLSIPTEMSWPGFSIRPSVNSSSASPRSSRPRSDDELGVREDPQQRALAGVAHPPAARPGGELHGGRMTGDGDHVLPRVEVDHHVGDRREALLPLLADEVAVGRRQEVLVRHRAEQATEGAGQQQGAGAGVDPLAGHVDQRDLQDACRRPSGWPPGSRRRTTPPPADRSTTSADHPSGSGGISPWAVSRSRRSTSIESPAGALHAEASARAGQQVDDRRGQPPPRAPRPATPAGPRARSPARSPTRRPGRAGRGCAPTAGTRRPAPPRPGSRAGTRCGSPGTGRRARQHTGSARPARRRRSARRAAGPRPGPATRRPSRARRLDRVAAMATTVASVTQAHGPDGEAITLALCEGSGRHLP